MFYRSQHQTISRLARKTFVHVISRLIQSTRKCQTSGYIEEVEKRCTHLHSMGLLYKISNEVTNWQVSNINQPCSSPKQYPVAVPFLPTHCRHCGWLNVLVQLYASKLGLSVRLFESMAIGVLESVPYVT